MQFRIYFDKMILTRQKNLKYKYLWQDLDLCSDSKALRELIKSGLITEEFLNQDLTFSTAEEAFLFIEKEKDNFAYSNECVVIADKGK